MDAGRLTSMTSTTAPTGDTAHARLGDLARRHLWMHMATAEADVDAMAILTRGEGCYVWDDRGKRYLDGLAGLFAVNVGHGRAELAAAAGSQAGELPFFPIWGNAHPPAIELAARLAGLAPDHLNRVFFTGGGSEAVETAWKLTRQYFRAIAQPKRSKVIARHFTYHGTTMGALVLLVSDEVICAFGRIGHWFGCQRYGYEPDLLTFAKGLTSGYAPMGGVLVSGRVAEPFLACAAPFLHGFTFGGHPVCAAVALGRA